MSGSDMELPQQAINSLIQRTTESSSDGEGHQLPNPQTLFANSLLQQFVPNNPLLSPPAGHTLTSSVSDGLSPSKSLNTSSASAVSSCQNSSVTSASKSATVDANSQSAKVDASADGVSVKRGRGRPKRGARGRKHKVEEALKGLERGGEKNMQDFCVGPNVSPDSGIQNSPDHVSSPEPSLSPNIRLKHPPQTKDDSKKTTPPNIPEAKVQNRRQASQERYSKRIVSQEKQAKNSSQERVEVKEEVQEKPASRTRTQELQSSRNSSQEKHQSTRTSSQEKSSRTVQEKHSSRNSSQEKHTSSSSRNSSQEKSVNKLSVTSNQFDRVLYANADRVLYPPRRKVGRPPVRRPGRPPKHKVDNTEQKGQEKPVPSFKGKLLCFFY